MASRDTLYYPNSIYVYLDMLLFVYYILLCTIIYYYILLYTIIYYYILRLHSCVVLTYSLRILLVYYLYTISIVPLCCHQNIDSHTVYSVYSSCTIVTTKALLYPIYTLPIYQTIYYLSTTAPGGAWEGWIIHKQAGYSEGLIHFIAI